MNAHHHHFMSLALKLAEQGRFTVSPNPMVGCVIVKDGQIIGEGYHQKAGGPHAEIHALQQAGKNACGATAYVTLEPCCHHGKTPPCTDALIQAGIKHVFVACADPNPLVAGKGLAQLRQSGIHVETDILNAEAQKLNDIFFHFIQSQRPFVMAKWAMSLDGKTITHAADSRQISNHSSQQHAHQLRQQVDAILIGADTAIQDNPLLTVRHVVENESIRHPLRIILSSHDRLPLDLKLFDPSLPGKTMVVTTIHAKPHWITTLREKNIEVCILPYNAQHQVDLHGLLDELGKRQITSLLVEGGMTVLESFFNENLVNQIHAYIAPVIIGRLPNKKFLHDVEIMRIDDDYHFTTHYRGNHHV